MAKKSLLILSLFLSLIAKVSLADDFVEANPKNPHKKFSGQIIAEIFNNDIYNSSDKNNERLLSFGRLRIDSALQITNKISIDSSLKLKELPQGTEKSGGNNSFFASEAAFVEKLTLNYNSDNFALAGGKFTADFGKGWKWRNGIWNMEIARNNYRYNERLGGSASLKAGKETGSGRYIFTLSNFTADNKLDNSAFTKRDNVISANAVSNTSSLSSYALSMNIDYDFSELNAKKAENHQGIMADNIEEKLSYHFAYINLAADKQATATPQNRIGDQKGYVADINYLYPLTQNLSGEIFSEYVNFNNFDGNSDKTASFLNTNLTFFLCKNWNLTFAYNRQHKVEAGAANDDQAMKEVSLGYKFDDKSLLAGLHILGGYKLEKISAQNDIDKNNVLGILLRYVKNF